MLEVRENGLVVTASGWGKEGVGQQQNPTEQTPLAFPCQPSNEGQLPSPSAHLREQSTGGTAPG